MSINSINNNLYNAYNKSPLSNTTAQTGAPAAAKEKTEANPAAIVSISEEAKSGATEAKKTSTQVSEETQGKAEGLGEYLASVKKQADGAAKSFEIQRKCLAIAMRIMSGDKVPNEDHRFLMKNDPELYSKAIMMRQEKVNPEEYKRLSEDKDDADEKAAEDASGSVQTPEISDQTQASEESSLSPTSTDTEV
ncbi:MAG: hypothetical protein LBU73_03560 [Helicobacteraceae bacterium]|jgi:hypothetical protein|nr:hypothetical protein [Helicobacteraceae bacterium]